MLESSRGDRSYVESSEEQRSVEFDVSNSGRCNQGRDDMKSVALHIFQALKVPTRNIRLLKDAPLSLITMRENVEYHDRDVWCICFNCITLLLRIFIWTYLRLCC